MQAISKALGSAGIPYQYVSIFRRELFPKNSVGPMDFPLGATETRFDTAHFLDDLRAGLFLQCNDTVIQRISKIAIALQATHIQLEQPFVFPIYDRLKSIAGLSHLRLIYSSQNVEAPLKRAILQKYNSDPEIVVEACELIERWERSAVMRSELTIAVTEREAAIYRDWGGKCIVVCRNGVDKFPVDPSMRQKVRSIFSGRPFAMVVGSAYPPNSTGFLTLVVEQALSFLPPRLAIAVAGGMGHGVWQHPAYQAAQMVNDRRIFFFPDITDGELGAIKEEAHAFLLPILDGGGSNLKAAEALISGKHILGTGLAFRGYDEFRTDEGVTIVDDAKCFRSALRDVLEKPALAITYESRKRREALYWPHILRALVRELERGALRLPARQCMFGSATTRGPRQDL